MVLFVVSSVVFVLGGVKSVEELLRTCGTSQLEQELMNKYILIEDYFMRESLCKVSVFLPLHTLCPQHLPSGSLNGHV